MPSLPPPAADAQPPSPTCAACLTPLDSVEHHYLCVAPLDQLCGDA